LRLRMPLTNIPTELSSHWKIRPASNKQKRKRVPPTLPQRLSRRRASLTPFICNIKLPTTGSGNIPPIQTAEPFSPSPRFSSREIKDALDTYTTGTNQFFQNEEPNDLHLSSYSRSHSPSELPPSSIMSPLKSIILQNTLSTAELQKLEALSALHKRRVFKPLNNLEPLESEFEQPDVQNTEPPQVTEQFLEPSLEHITRRKSSVFVLHESSASLHYETEDTQSFYSQLRPESNLTDQDLEELLNDFQYVKEGDPNYLSAQAQLQQYSQMKAPSFSFSGHEEFISEASQRKSVDEFHRRCSVDVDHILEQMSSLRRYSISNQLDMAELLA